MRKDSILTEAQFSALWDAHLSLYHGGLSEVSARRGNVTVWIGGQPDCAIEHSNSTVHFLFVEGLLTRMGDRPTRTAEITEKGILELDCAGAQNEPCV